MPRVGDVIGGKYRLDALVGSGGMGLVYAATHVSLDQSVALKFVRHDPKTDETATVRLLREARVVAGLKSEHVARVHDVGLLDDGAPYLIMELLEGSTLEALVRTEGPLSVADASECIIQACHALGEAHSLGVVHRDVKPSNLFRTLDSAGQMRLKVIDFGISRARPGTEPGEAQPTRTGAFLGSPPFMSPEQILEAKDVDARSDVWSLGVVLYFLLSARLPFEAPSLLELMTRIAYEEPAPLTGTREDVPAGLAEIVARCMRKERDERFATVGELADALVPHAHERARSVAGRIVRGEVPTSSARVPPADDTAPTDDDALASRTRSLAPGTGTVSALLEAAPARKSASRAVVVGGAVALASVSALVLFAVGRMHGGAAGPIATIATTTTTITTTTTATVTSAPESPASATTAAEIASAPAPPVATAESAPSRKSAPRPAPGAPRPRSNRAKADPPASTARPVVSAPPGRPSLPTTPD